MIPPSHERSWSAEDIFLPVIFPAAIAANPAIKVKSAVRSGEIPNEPLLSPVAAESSELASASAAASAGESVFESSMSAAVSSRYSFMTSPLLPVRSESSPFSESLLISMRTRLLKTVRTPIDVRTISPRVRQIPAGMNETAMSETSSEIPSTPAPVRFITAAEVSGIVMPLLQ